MSAGGCGYGSFYVSYGDEEAGLLYGLLWLGGEAVILQTCGQVTSAPRITR